VKWPFVGVYALLDSPIIPFLEKIGYLPGKHSCGWVATRDRTLEGQQPLALFSFTDTSCEVMGGRLCAGPESLANPALYVVPVPGSFSAPVTRGKHEDFGLVFADPSYKTRSPPMKINFPSD